ncbi:hypothetical protein Bca52824_027371 [Brassica carinata]|uniref:CMP/dCMP-type deaminase domain-containing protein n=1 Tax=Brassica carinata TaxID=52824 RepID=A0A8X7SJJ0_BRACI|nr:hypothetical protein Bca52824_027371 [Brassica carinata]
MARILNPLVEVQIIVNLGEEKLIKFRNGASDFYSDMQIACLPIPISSITLRASIPSSSVSSNHRRAFNMAAFQNSKHSFFTVASKSSRTGFKSSVLADVMRSEEALDDDDDAFYMRRCVELSKRANGCTSPNPMVGCVLVKDIKVVGEGFHPKAGQPHAEVFAL